MQKLSVLEFVTSNSSYQKNINSLISSGAYTKQEKINGLNSIASNRSYVFLKSMIESAIYTILNTPEIAQVKQSAPKPITIQMNTALALYVQKGALNAKGNEMIKSFARKHDCIVEFFVTERQEARSNKKLTNKHLQEGFNIVAQFISPKEGKKIKVKLLKENEPLVKRVYMRVKTTNVTVNYDELMNAVKHLKITIDRQITSNVLADVKLAKLK
jgi:hypothetical protein